VKPGQKGVQAERKTKKPEGTYPSGFPPPHTFHKLAKNNFFLYQLASPTLPPSPRTPPVFPLSTTKATITYITDKYMKKSV
jgi:hypothetical protein